MTDDIKDPFRGLAPNPTQSKPTITDAELKAFRKGKPLNATTGTKHSPYDASWKRVRLYILDRDHYLCQLQDSDMCYPGHVQPAVEVDHLVPVDIRSDLRLDERNLRASCLPCNRRKAVTDRTAAGMQRIRALSASMPPINKITF